MSKISWAIFVWAHDVRGALREDKSLADWSCGIDHVYALPACATFAWAHDVRGALASVQNVQDSWTQQPSARAGEDTARRIESISRALARVQIQHGGSSPPKLSAAAERSRR